MRFPGEHCDTNVKFYPQNGFYKHLLCKKDQYNGGYHSIIPGIFPITEIERCPRLYIVQYS